MSKHACASHILVKSERDAKHLKRQLNKGTDFALLAKKYLTCPSAKKGGDLGEFRKGVMVKQFDLTVFTTCFVDKHQLVLSLATLILAESFVD